MDTPSIKPPRGKAAEEIGRAYRQYSSELKSFFARYSRRMQSSDDLMQEVYLELLRFTPRELVREPQAYLYKIAWNVVNRSNERLQRDAVPHEPQNLERIADRTATGGMSDPSLAVNAQQQILRVLSQLPPLYGAVVVLSRRDGLSYSEIARELKISTHTVRKYLTRAIAHLKNASWDE